MATIRDIWEEFLRKQRERDAAKVSTVNDIGSQVKSKLTDFGQRVSSIPQSLQYMAEQVGPIPIKQNVKDFVSGNRYLPQEVSDIGSAVERSPDINKNSKKFLNLLTPQLGMGARTLQAPQKVIEGTAGLFKKGDTGQDLLKIAQGGLLGARSALELTNPMQNIFNNYLEPTALEALKKKSIKDVDFSYAAQDKWVSDAFNIKNPIVALAVDLSTAILTGKVENMAIKSVDLNRMIKFLDEGNMDAFYELASKYKDITEFSKKLGQVDTKEFAKVLNKVSEVISSKQEAVPNKVPEIVAPETNKWLERGKDLGSRADDAGANKAYQELQDLKARSDISSKQSSIKNQIQQEKFKFRTGALEENKLVEQRIKNLESQLQPDARPIGTKFEPNVAPKAEMSFTSELPKIRKDIADGNFEIDRIDDKLAELNSKQQQEFGDLYRRLDQIEDKQVFVDMVTGKVEVPTELRSTVDDFKNVMEFLAKEEGLKDINKYISDYFPAISKSQVLDQEIGELGPITMLSKSLAELPHLKSKTNLEYIGDASLGETLKFRVNAGTANILKDARYGTITKEGDIVSQIERMSIKEGTKTSPLEETVGLLSDTKLSKEVKDLGALFTNELENAYHGGWKDLGLQEEVRPVYMGKKQLPAWELSVRDSVSEGKNLTDLLADTLSYRKGSEQFSRLEGWINAVEKSGDERAIQDAIHKVGVRVFLKNPLNDLYNTLKTKTINDKRTRQFLNDELYNMLNPYEDYGGFIDALNKFRRLEQVASIGGNIGTMVMQPFEIGRLYGVIDPATSTKALFDTMSGTKSQFDWMKGDVKEYLVGGKTISRGNVNKVLKVLEDAGYAGVAATEGFKNKVYIRAFELDGINKGLKGDALQKHVFDGYSKYAWDMSLEGLPKLMRNPLARFGMMFQTYAVKGFSSIVRSASEIGKGNNIGKELAALAATFAASYASQKALDELRRKKSTVADTILRTATGFKPEGYNPLFDVANWTARKYNEDYSRAQQEKENKLYGNDYEFDREYDLKKIDNRLRQSANKTFVPFGNQVLNKTLPAIEADTKDEVPTYSGNVATPGPRTLWDKITSYGFGRTATGINQKRWSEGLPPLNEKESAHYRTLNSDSARKKYYDEVTQDKKAYFDSVDEAVDFVYKDDPEGLDVYKKYKASKKANDDYLDNPVSEFFNSSANINILLSNSKIAQVEILTNKLKSMKTGKPLDPFYDLTPGQRQVIWNMKQEVPGSSEKTKLKKENESWYYDYMNERGKFFDQLKAEGVDFEGDKDWDSFSKQTATPAKLKPTEDAYYAIPKENKVTRQAFLVQHPELKAWWDEKDRIEDKQRNLLGYGPQDKFGSGGYGGYGSSDYKTVNGRKVPKGLTAATYKKPPALKSSKAKVSAVKLPKGKAPKKPAKAISMTPPEIKGPQLTSIGYGEKPTTKLKKIKGKKISLN